MMMVRSGQHTHRQPYPEHMYAELHHRVCCGSNAPTVWLIRWHVPSTLYLCHLSFPYYPARPSTSGMSCISSSVYDSAPNPPRCQRTNQWSPYLRTLTGVLAAPTQIHHRRALATHVGAAILNSRRYNAEPSTSDQQLRWENNHERRAVDHHLHADRRGAAVSDLRLSTDSACLYQARGY